MGVLAHVFEAAGLATVGLSLVRRQAENIRAPRMMHCQFPLGRPLGRPGDPAFQRDVLRRALGLIDRTDVPVLVDHPEVIEEQGHVAASCPIPPSFDGSLHPAVGEVAGLRSAYDRQLVASGRTMVGQVGDADSVAQAVERIISIADGVALADIGVDTQTFIGSTQDVRAYYEEAALALMNHVPEARQTERWFYDRTETGKVIKAAVDALKAANVDGWVWGFMMPKAP